MTLVKGNIARLPSLPFDPFHFDVPPGTPAQPGPRHASVCIETRLGRYRFVTVVLANPRGLGRWCRATQNTHFSRNSRFSERAPAS